MREDRDTERKVELKVEEQTGAPGQYTVKADPPEVRVEQNWFVKWKCEYPFVISFHGESPFDGMQLHSKAQGKTHVVKERNKVGEKKVFRYGESVAVTGRDGGTYITYSQSGAVRTYPPGRAPG